MLSDNDILDLELTVGKWDKDTQREVLMILKQLNYESVEDVYEQD